MEKFVIDEKMLKDYMKIKELIYDLNLSREGFLMEVKNQTTAGKKISEFFEQFGENSQDEMNSFVEFMFKDGEPLDKDED